MVSGKRVRPLQNYRAVTCHSYKIGELYTDRAKVTLACLMVPVTGSIMPGVMATHSNVMVCIVRVISSSVKIPEASCCKETWIWKALTSSITERAP